MRLVKKVETYGEAEIIRQIRNTGRHNLKFNKEITVEQQEEWWKHLDHLRNILYLFSEATLNGDIFEAEKPVGYGMISLNDVWWLTVVVKPKFYNKGWSTVIHQFMASICPVNLYAETLKTNLASIRSSIKAGYVIAYEKKDYTVLVHKK